LKTVGTTNEIAFQGQSDVSLTSNEHHKILRCAEVNVELSREMFVEKSLRLRLCERIAQKALRFSRISSTLLARCTAVKTLGNEAGSLFQVMQLRDPRILYCGTLKMLVELSPLRGFICSHVTL
jgi:hypothetical protein